MNTFDEIIQTKAYSDLTPNELEVIRELVSSEEEYNEMKSFYAGIDQLAISNIAEVSPSVKSSLNSVFQAKHPGISQNWNAPEAAEKKVIPLYNRTLFRVAALLVLSAGVTTIWFSMSENQLASEEKVQMTASNDTMLREEKTAAEPKKKFPLNEGTKKQFTADSNIPADEAPETSILTNGTSYSYTSALLKKSDEPGKKSEKIQPAAPVTYYFNASKEKETKDGDAESFSKAGLDADLHPGGFYAEPAKDFKPSIKTTDLLSLIEPSF
ncbi:MAG: hypothetical protein K0S23_200 [Fluviicola sp.]|jgi:hypothetical protein|uniref:hypothetical protein n=1 Tax=Fluviicola sp. TaxID=1917219 RepID=UPI00260DEBF0|nr:hypothetical protein [Fluviicola sp.]MDF3025893.1 hypothetical protein [Fluviicola sp.]